MNLEAIDRAITVMQRVQQLEEMTRRTLLDMNSWQNSATPASFHKSEEEVLQDCGTTCCFAGWLAVAPEFPELQPGKLGYPVLQGRVDNACCVTSSLRELFGVPESMIDDLIFPEDHMDVQDVIDTLQSWKDREQLISPYELESSK